MVQSSYEEEVYFKNMLIPNIILDIDILFEDFQNDDLSH
jgi:hypothetical protein